MAIADRIGINASGVIFYDSTAGAQDHTTAGAEYYTVIELHRFLQDLADDASSSGDDLIDITNDTPSDRSTDNIIQINAGYTLDNGAVGGGDPVWEHLYDGSIIEADSGSIYDGLVVIAAEGMDLQIIQNGSVLTDDWWNNVPNGETAGSHGLNRDVANGISHRFMLKVNNAGTDIDGRRIVGMTREIGYTYSEFKINGTARGNNVLALTYTADLNDTTDASARSTISNVTWGYNAIDINNDTTDEYNYSEWNMDTYTSKQFYERMKWLSACETALASGTGTNATPNSAAFYNMDANIFRGITHEITLGGTGSPTGTFGTADGTHNGQPEAVSWTGGTGQLLAIDNTASASATKMWIQLLTGTAPSTDGVDITGGDSAAVVQANGTTTERTVATPFCGQSTGSAMIGAYGFAIEYADTTNADLFRALDNSTYQPPNNVSFTVGGVVHDEDRILVGPENGSGGLRSDQCQVATGEAITVTAGAVSSATTGAGVAVLASNTETIGTSQPSAKDTPASGNIRVLDSNSIFQIISYTGFTASAGEIDFTGCTSSGTWSAAATNDAFIAYIDELASGAVVNSDSLVVGVEYEILTDVADDYTTVGAANDNVGTRFVATGTDAGGTGTVYQVVTTASFNAVYDSDRDLFIRVRDGGTDGDNTGIKTFETTGTLGAAGGSSTAIRTSDA
jgi:hypothetical protein